MMPPRVLRDMETSVRQYHLALFGGIINGIGIQAASKFMHFLSAWPRNRQAKLRGIERLGAAFANYRKQTISTGLRLPARVPD